MAYFMAGVANAEIFKGKDLFATAKTLTDSSVTIGVTGEDVKAGQGAMLYGKYFHSATMGLKMTDAMFRLEYIAANVGSEIELGGDVFYEEEVKVPYNYSGKSITLAKTAVPINSGAKKIYAYVKKTGDTYYTTKEVINNAITLDVEGKIEPSKNYYEDSTVVPSPKSYFTVNSTGETITGLTDTGKTQTELVIPYEIDGVKITKLENIGTSNLAGNSVITKVILPNSIVTIGNNAFQHCTSLSSINIPSSVTSIGNYAFDNCTGLTSINIPNSVTYIGMSAFEGCTGLKSINIPNSVTYIENSTFQSCTGLTSINIPNSVISIGSSAFDNCTGLKSINIPNSVTYIENSAFSGCTNLTIYCEQGSYAEAFANKNNIPVKYIDPSIIDIENNVQYCVKYLYTNEAARKITINANFTPDTLSVYLTAPLFAGDASDPSTGTKVGSVTIKVPRFLLSGSQELTMSMTGAATTAFEGSALASNPEGCEGNAIYAEIIEVIKDRTIDDITYVIEGSEDGVEIKLKESYQFQLYACMKDSIPILVDNTKYYWSLSPDDPGLSYELTNDGVLTVREIDTERYTQMDLTVSVFDTPNPMTQKKIAQILVTVLS